MMRKDVTLANRLLHKADTRSLLKPNLDLALKGLIRKSERFVLTDSAAVKVGEAIHAFPEMLVHNGEFARAPFSNCWIEFPVRNFHNAVVPGSGSLHNETSDVRVGYLFSHNTVYVAAITENGQPDFSPFIYDINTPSSFQAERALVDDLGISRLSLDQMYWGVGMSAGLDREIVRQFRAQHSIRLAASSLYIERIRNAGMGLELIHGCAGEMRNIIGLLLMLNQPKLIRYVGERPAYRATTHRGTKSYVGHREIEIDLNRKPITVILGTPKGTHASPRQHDVAGSYAHRHRSPICEHNWEADDDNHWHCTDCSGRRWWRRDHKRGDPNKGVVVQDRTVVFND